MALSRLKNKRRRDRFIVREKDVNLIPNKEMAPAHGQKKVREAPFRVRVGFTVDVREEAMKGYLTNNKRQPAS